jgi:hypothetical protein
MSDEARDRPDSLLLDTVLGPLAEAVRQSALPLHILLENRFGELNDNQAEMIAAARDGVEAADVLLRRAQRVRALEGRPSIARTETTRVLDLCRGPLAIASAQEAHRGVRFEEDLSPALPRVRGDRANLEEALTLAISDAAGRAADHAIVVITATQRGAERLLVVLRHGAPVGAASLDRLLARRLVEGEGGELVEVPGELQLTLRT